MSGTVIKYVSRDAVDIFSCALSVSQALLQQLASQIPEKDSLGPLLATLTSHLPTENPDREGFQDQFDELTSRWSNLSDKLGQCHANLDSALALAKTYEGATEKLLPWVPDTLGRLENLGPPPTDPEAVEKLKSEIEVSVCVCVCVSVVTAKW